MPAVLECVQSSVTAEETMQLWEAVRRERNVSDAQVVVRCVAEQEMRELNKLYRGKDYPTNVLTFSYHGQSDFPGEDLEEHDIALCMSVAEKEANEKRITIRDYTALLLVHAFLHVAGMDHEKSLEEDTATRQLENNILSLCGFQSMSLGGHD